MNDELPTIRLSTAVQCVRSVADTATREIKKMETVALVCLAKGIAIGIGLGLLLAKYCE